MEIQSNIDPGVQVLKGAKKKRMTFKQSKFLLRGIYMQNIRVHLS